MSLAAYPAYENYDESGIDWIERFPSHWSLQPVRASFSFRNEKNDPVITDNILSLSIAHGVTLYNEEGRGGNKRKDDLSAYKIARPDDIVLNSMNVIVGAVGRSKYFGAISPVYYALQAKNKDTSIDYFEKVFTNAGFQRGLLRLGKGILIKLSGTGKLNTIRMKISQSDLKNVILPFPPPDEQAAIVSFLDGKCDKIDEAVRIKEAQIALLRERRQILIQEAVTRGLNPDAPMKDSGIDWIGQIPAHWEVVRGKHLFGEINERSDDGSEELLSVSHTTGVTSRSEKNINMFMAEDYSGSKLCKSGDIVINTMWAWMGAMGVSGLRGIVSPSYGVYRPLDGISFNNRFVEWLIRTTPYIEHYNKISTGLHSSRLRLYPHMFLGMYFGFPSREEQDRIVQHVEAEAKKIDTAVTLKQEQITALKEYKTSLINAAVTGKIKVI